MEGYGMAGLERGQTTSVSRPPCMICDLNQNSHTARLSQRSPLESGQKDTSLKGFNFQVSRAAWIDVVQRSVLCSVRLC